MRPASQRRTVLTSTWTMSANSSSVSPARVIAVLRFSYSKASPLSESANFQGLSVDVRSCPRTSSGTSRDVLAPSGTSLHGDEHAHGDPADGRLARPGWSRGADPG